MNLGTFGCMATEADFRLRKLVQHLLVRIVGFVAIGTGQPVGLMLTARPVCPRANLGLVTRETGGVPLSHRRQALRLGAEDYIGRLTWILLVRSALAVASLAARGTLIALDAVFGLVDREHRLGPVLVVASGALLVPFKRPVRLSPRGQAPKNRDSE